MNEHQFESVTTSMTPTQKNAAYCARAKAICHGIFGELLPIGLVAALLGAALGTGVDLLAGGVVGFFASYFGIATSLGRALLLIAATVLTVALPILFVASVLISSPLRLGMQRFALGLFDGEDAEMGTVFSYFRQGYVKSVTLNLLYTVVTALPTAVLGAATLIPLWLCREDVLRAMTGESGGAACVLIALILLAVIAVAVWTTCFLIYSYRFAFTVMAEHPHMNAIEAMRVSRTMMSGHRRGLFLLDLRFVGWSLLAIPTFGLSHAFVAPRRELTLAAFYDELTNRSSAKEVMFPSLNFDDYVIEEAEEKEEKSAHVPQKAPVEKHAETADENAGGMPFTSELLFPSLDPTDYVADDDDGLFHRKRVKRDKPQNKDEN